MMKTTNLKRKQGLFLCLVFSLILIGLGLQAPMAQADLPDRPTLEAPKKDNDDSKERSGAYIELQAPGFSGWSEVQWQDADGNWQVVEGWRGSLVDGTIRWWVDPKDFNTGPFRWVVFDQPGGTVRAVSEGFYLPQSAWDWVLVPISE
jgi:hypothetical protein